MDEGLGNSKYDYHNKEIDNSRYGHSYVSIPAMGTWKLMSLETERDRERKAELFTTTHEKKIQQEWNCMAILK